MLAGLAWTDSREGAETAEDEGILVGLAGDCRGAKKAAQTVGTPQGPCKRHAEIGILKTMKAPGRRSRVSGKPGIAERCYSIIELSPQPFPRKGGPLGAKKLCI